jgi:hypothetical protein
VADLEKDIYLLEQFTRTRIDMLSAKISNQFSIVNFKLFDAQVNGGITECCEAMVDGTPYRNLNTAKKINAGLDIINTLCRHYKVTAPIFIDNRESVNEIMPSESQIINLIVSKDESLRIENL